MDDVVAPVCVPLRSCNQAADLLIQWFGPEDLKLVVGGEKWWQVRGLDGIDAGWITEKSHLGPESVHLDAASQYSETEKLIMTMEQLKTTMASLPVSLYSLTDVSKALHSWRRVLLGVHQ